MNKEELKNTINWRRKVSEPLYPLATKIVKRKQELTDFGISEYSVFDKAVIEKLCLRDSDLVEFNNFNIESCKRRISKGGYNSVLLDELRKRNNLEYEVSKDILDLCETKVHKLIKSWDLKEPQSFVAWVDIVRSRYQSVFSSNAYNFMTQNLTGLSRKSWCLWLEENIFHKIGFSFCSKMSNSKKYFFRSSLNEKFDISFCFYDNVGATVIGDRVESYIILIRKGCTKFRIDCPDLNFVEYPLHLFFGDLYPPFGAIYSYNIEKKELIYMLYIHSIMFKIVYEVLNAKLIWNELE